MIPLTQALQNGTQYEIWLSRDDGTRLAVLDTVGAFSFTRVVNNVGAFHLTLPSGFNKELLKKDNRVLIWRKPVGGAMYLAFVGLTRSVRAKGSVVVRTISGLCLNDLLSTREIAYTAGSDQASPAAAPADTLMVNIVKQNLGSDAATERQLVTYLSIAPTPAAGPSLTRAFSFQNVLETLRRLSDASRAAGTSVFFGIVPTGESGFEFRTKINQWGDSRISSLANGLIFGPEYGNMENPDMIEDGSEEINFSYGLGRDLGASRKIRYAEATNRSRASYFARREKSINASSETTNGGVEAMATSDVLKGRSVVRFAGKLLSVPGSIYGKDWKFGDRVTCSYDDLQFDALIRAVTVSVDEKGMEHVDATAEALLYSGDTVTTGAFTGGGAV